MIPINFINDESIESLYHLLLNVKENQRGKNKEKYISKVRRINDWCKNNIKLNGRAYSFPDIIRADYETITKIAALYSKIVLKISDEDKNFLINSLYGRRFPRMEFVNELGVTVCPYCNRNFINSTKSRTMCELDHFFDKQTYPILAVSFYNLVPVCHNCNHAKGTKTISYSPHNDHFIADELVEFDFFFKGAKYLQDRTQIGIEVFYNEVLEENVKELKLKEVYNLHTDLIQELIEKTMIFNPVYLKNLCHLYDDLFHDEEELYRIIFGNYFNDLSYGKRPLSKFTKDIISKLFLETYGMDLRELYSILDTEKK